MSHKTEYIWTCKIGGPAIQFQSGADAPMRQAVQAAFKQVTGNHEVFCFSGWGGELTEPERAVVENRLPSAEHEFEWNRRAALAAQPGSVGEPDLRAENAKLREDIAEMVRSDADHALATFRAAPDAATKLRFFRDLTDDERLKVFKVFGLLTDEIIEAERHALTHITQSRLFERLLAAAPTEAKPAQQDAVDAARWRFISDRYSVAFQDGKFTSLNAVVSEEWRQTINASVDRMMAGDWSDADVAPAEAKPVGEVLFDTAFGCKAGQLFVDLPAGTSLYATPVSASKDSRQRDLALEECAALCDRFAKRQMSPEECRDAILAMKEQP